MWELLIEPFAAYGFMRRALTGCVAISVGATPIGVFLMLRRMSLTGDAMTHAILPGAAVGYLISGLSLCALTIGGLSALLGDMVERVGGEHVAVTSLVGPDGDAHVFQPTPADARRVSDADILFVNGLKFEGWIDRLIDASDFDGARIVATEGVERIAYAEGEEHAHDDHGDDGRADDHKHDHDEHAHKDHDHDHDDHAHDDHGDKEHGHDDHGHDEHAKSGHDDHDHGEFDPHAWRSPKNAVVYATNIAAALAQADPENAATYAANRDAYVAERTALDAEIGAILASIPESQRTVVTSHDAFQYFGRDYGLTFRAPQGLSTDSEAAAKDVAALIDQIREDEIRAVSVENITDKRLLERIVEETGAAIGGALYPGALSAQDGPALTYLDMMRHNASLLSQALGS
ncbi:MAG: zinc ABC transporter substrate-binding protein [Pseudomonadota bacterium]